MSKRLRQFLAVLGGGILGAAAFSVVGPPVQGIKERLVFRSARIELRGMLVRPTTEGPHPAIVLLHGSGGNQTHGKWYYRFHTDAFVRRGFAVLSYDKRGSGESGGDLGTATFHTLADDAVSAVTYLRTRSDIVPDEIGLLAVSESGWFAPEIAIKAGSVAFIINRAGPPVPWQTAVLFEMACELREQGIGEEDIASIRQFYATAWQYDIDRVRDPAAAGAERDAIVNQLAALRRRPGLDQILPEALHESSNGALDNRVSKLSWDPLPDLIRTEAPMLFILAGKDANVPFKDSLVVLDRLRTKYGRDVTVQAYPDAGHYFYRWSHLPIEGLYVPGYFDAMTSWAAQQVQGQPRDRHFAVPPALNGPPDRGSARTPDD